MPMAVTWPGAWFSKAEVSSHPEVNGGGGDTAAQTAPTGSRVFGPPQVQPGAGQGCVPSEVVRNRAGGRSRCVVVGGP